MTAQVPDRLMIGEQHHSLFTNPLEDYLERRPPRPPFMPRSTANWRGYVALWTIDNERLYLIDISARFRTRVPGSNERGSRDVTLADLFPGAVGTLHAEWYSGTLRVPQGKLIDYVHQGYGSQYERFLLIEVSEGVVCDRREIPGAPPRRGRAYSILDTLRSFASRLWRP